MVSTSSTNGNTKAIMASLMEAQAALYKTQQQAMSQKNILTPSDNPVGTSVILGANQELSNINSFKNNIDYLDTSASMLDSLYSSVWDKVSRINDLALSAANGTSASKELMQNYYDEVQSLKEDIVRLANTQFNGEYVFSGTNTGLAPFTLKDDGSIVYNGTASLNPDGSAIAGAEEYYAKKLEISQNTFVSINNPGDAVFGFVDNSTDPPSGTGLFFAIDEIQKAMDPSNFNQEEISKKLEGLQAGLENITSYRTKNGIIQSRIASAKELLENQELQTTERKSDVQDLDIVEAYSRMTQQYYAYQASMQIASQSMNLSLLNYL